MSNWKIINLGSDAPKCMPEVYFYQIPVGEVFLWKDNNYRKTAEETAVNIQTNKKWIFEIHYRVAISEDSLKKLEINSI